MVRYLENYYIFVMRAILNIITPKKIYMKEFLKEFSEKYNSIEEYLKLIGVKDYIIKDIKRKYIE